MKILVFLISRLKRQTQKYNFFFKTGHIILSKFAPTLYNFNRIHLEITKNSRPINQRVETSNFKSGLVNPNHFDLLPALSRFVAKFTNGFDLVNLMWLTRKFRSSESIGLFPFRPTTSTQCPTIPKIGISNK